MKSGNWASVVKLHNECFSRCTDCGVESLLSYIGLCTLKSFIPWTVVQRIPIFDFVPEAVDFVHQQPWKELEVDLEDEGKEALADREAHEAVECIEGAPEHEFVFIAESSVACVMASDAGFDLAMAFVEQFVFEDGDLVVDNDSGL